MNDSQEKVEICDELNLRKIHGFRCLKALMFKFWNCEVNFFCVYLLYTTPVNSAFVNVFNQTFRGYSLFISGLRATEK